MIAALVAAGVTGGGQWDRLAAPSVDAGVVAAHEQVMRALAGTYITGDPRAMLPAAAGFADGLAPLLKRAPTHELGLRLATVAVDAHSMAGIMAFHAGDPVLTQRHLAQAGHVADTSTDPLLRARAWAMLAHYVHSPLWDGHGSSRRAVVLVGRARALARHADGHTREYLGAGLAEEAAEAGDVALCEWALEDAGRALDTATGHDGGLFSPAGLYGDVRIWLGGMSRCVTGLAGRLDEAERAIGGEIAAAQNARQHVNALCALGAVRVKDAQPEGACAALREAVDLALATANRAKLPRAGAVRLKMPPTWDPLGCVTDLDEQLRLVA